jgi:hypothetical protein
MRARLALISLLCLAVTACSNGVLSPSEHLRLSAARERWEEHGGPNYTVESRLLCFCAPYLTTWTRLTVHDGVLVSAEPLGPIFGGEEGSLLGWRTVTQVFEAIVEVSRSDYATEIDLRFDEALGYPLEFSVTCRSDILDCGSSHQMRNLVLLP